MILPLDDDTRNELGHDLDGLPTDAGALAVLVSTVPFVPFTLLRRMRRAALPSGSRDVEAKLCSSALVETIASDGLVMESEAVDMMRRRLRQVAVREGADMTGVRRVVEECATTLSPLLQLESSMVWHYVENLDFLPKIDEMLTAVSRTIAFDRRESVLSWASGALIRLPAEMLKTTGAWTLAQLCAAAGLPSPKLDLPDADVEQDLLAAASWLLPDRLIGFRRDGGVLEMGIISAQRRSAMTVPVTTPLVVWVTVEGRDTTLVRFDQTLSPPVTLSTGLSRVNLRTIDGRTVELDEITGEKAPETQETDRTIDRLEGARRSRESLLAEVVQPSRNGRGLIVRIQDEAGLNAVMPGNMTSFADLPVGMLGMLLQGIVKVRIETVDRVRQRVVVRRVSGKWSAGTLTVGTELIVQVMGKSVAGIYFCLNEAAGVPQPDFEPLVGMLPTQNLLPEADWVRDGTGRSARSYPTDIGDKMRIVVLSIDPRSRRIRLAMLPPGASGQTDRGDLWPPQHTSVGSVVSAVVAEKKYFGILVTVSHVPQNSEASVETNWPGLIVNTELSWVHRWTRYSDARDFPLQIGDSILAKVIGFDQLAHRLRLSIKQVTSDPAPSVVARLKVGQRVVGTLVAHKGSMWTVNIEPWCVTTRIHDRHFNDLEPKAQMRIRAIVEAIGADTNSIVLRNLSAC